MEIHDDYYRIALMPCDIDDEMRDNFRGLWRMRQVYEVSESQTHVYNKVTGQYDKEWVESNRWNMATTFEFTNYIDAVYLKMAAPTDVINLKNNEEQEIVWGKPWRTRGFRESAPTLASELTFAEGVIIPDYTGVMGGDRGIPTPQTTDTAFFALGVPPEKVGEVDGMIAAFGGTKHYDSQSMLTWKGDRHFLQVTMGEDRRLEFRAKFKEWIETEATL